MMEQTPLNPHIIRFFTRKETEYYEIAGKRIPKPILTASIPSTGCLSRAPLVLKGEHLKPFPGMSKNILVQFLGDSNRVITVTNPVEINMCCDKCMTVITPDIPISAVYHIRIGFNCKKMERAILSDKSLAQIKLDSFEVNLNNSIDKMANDSHHQQHQQHQQHHHHQLQAQQSQQQQQQPQHHIHQEHSSPTTPQMIIEDSHIQQNVVVEHQSSPHQDSTTGIMITTDDAHSNSVNINNGMEIDKPPHSPESVMLTHTEDHHQHQQQQENSNNSSPNIISTQINNNSNNNNHSSHPSSPEIILSQPIQTIQTTQQDIESEPSSPIQNPLQSEINSHTFENEEYIIWSNEIVVPIEVSKINEKNQTSASALNNNNKRSSSYSSSNRKKKLKTSKNAPPSPPPPPSPDLLQQIMNGDLEAIKSYLENKNQSTEFKVVYDFERKDEDGFSPLHYACAYGMNGLVEFLLKSAADPNSTDKEGWTPLHWSVKANNLDAVHLLLEFGADQSVPNHSRQYPVEMAYDKGFSHIAATLHGMSEYDFKKNNESSLENVNSLTILANTTLQEDVGGGSGGVAGIGGVASQEYKLLLKHGLEPYVPDNFVFKSGVVEKHNTLKFIQAAEKLGLTPDHRSALMEAFKSLRTLRYRLFWIMLSNTLFSKICEWDSDGINFLVHNKDTLLSVLGLYFGLRGSNSAIDWMSHLARRKCNKTTNGSGDVWINLRASTFNSSTNLEKLKDITSEKSSERSKKGGKDEALENQIQQQQVQQVQTIQTQQAQQQQTQQQQSHSGIDVTSMVVEPQPTSQQPDSPSLKSVNPNAGSITIVEEHSGVPTEINITNDDHHTAQMVTEHTHQEHSHPLSTEEINSNIVVVGVVDPHHQQEHHEIVHLTSTSSSPQQNQVVVDPVHQIHLTSDVLHEDHLIQSNQPHHHHHHHHEEQVLDHHHHHHHHHIHHIQDSIQPTP
ncbi:hypothetical protein CYY_006625 [Polysphondylium violaceum]|uniref:Ankyrin repeat-containing protein n=1 Tax=Polysphondylium violaceum TaxID=133409 RepID=A0A8J4V5Q1_9MYCE|nr:hypothetical protein CYY_006625 [Polysphondylium violaceum]